MSYRPALIGRAPAQFSDLMGEKAIYDALMERIIQLADAPWDAWPVYLGGTSRGTSERKVTLSSPAGPV